MPRPAAPVATPGVSSVSTNDGGDVDADAATAAAPDLIDGPADGEDIGSDQPAARGAGASKAKMTGKVTVTMTKDELQAMLNRAAAQGAAAVSRASSPAAKPNPEADLPDQTEIDPAKIKSPTLSKQGYVVPLNYGDPANVAIKR